MSQHVLGASPTAGSSPATLPFGAELEPVLRRACGDRLSSVRWFRTEWQHGGALTGYATYQDDENVQQDVVVKLPVKPNECRWLLRLQSTADVVPRVYANGDNLNGYDMAWVIMEHLPHGPLSASWNGQEFDLIVEAAGRFYTAASHFPVDAKPPEEDWLETLARSRDWVRSHKPEHEKRWSKALKQAQRKLDDWLTIWSDRPTDQWCHGDLHLANAMTRHPAPQGPAVLLDFALTHAGHWVEDAVYFEHQYWSRREKLEGRKLCRMLAKRRKELGLPVEKDWSQWASVRRALLAIRCTAIRRFRQDPRHLLACLSILEKEISSR